MIYTLEDISKCSNKCNDICESLYLQSHDTAFFQGFLSILENHDGQCLMSKHFKSLFHKLLNDHSINDVNIDDIDKSLSYDLCLYLLCTLIEINKMIAIKLLSTFISKINIKTFVKIRNNSDINDSNMNESKLFTITETNAMTDTIMRYNKLQTANFIGKTFRESVIFQKKVLKMTKIIHKPENESIMCFFSNALDTLNKKGASLNDRLCRTFLGKLIQEVKCNNDDTDKTDNVDNTDNNIILYDIVEYILKNKYATYDSFEHSVYKNSKYRIAEIFLKHGMKFKKEYFDIIISNEAKNNKAKNIKHAVLSSDVLEFISNCNIDIDYSYILYACEHDLIFPNEYIKGIAFDSEYLRICSANGCEYYDKKIIGNVANYDMKKFEDMCYSSRNAKKIKSTIDEHNIKPTMKCLERACYGSIDVVLCLLSYGLNIDAECMKIIIAEHCSDDRVAFILEEYCKHIEQNNNNINININTLNENHLNENNDDDDNNNDYDNYENVITHDFPILPDCDDKKKKKVTLFHPICSSLKNNGYVTLSSFKKHMLSYITDNNLHIGNNFILINDALSKLSGINQNNFINKNDVNNLAISIFTKQ